MAKEKSFVEKGFVETMKQPTVEVDIRIAPLEHSTDSNVGSLQVKPAPDSTPLKRGSIAASAAAAAASTTPQPFVGSPALQERLEEKVANLQTQQDLLQSKETIKGCGIPFRLQYFGFKKKLEGNVLMITSGINASKNDCPMRYT